MKRIKSDSSIPLPPSLKPGAGLYPASVRHGRVGVTVNMWRTLKPYARRAGYRTQGDLATALGVTREHLCRVCRGQVYFTEHLQRSITYLLGLSHPEQNHAFGFPGVKPISLTDISTKGAPESGGVLARAASG